MTNIKELLNGGIAKIPICKCHAQGHPIKLFALEQAINIIQYIKAYEGDNQDVWFDELQAKADRWIKEWM